MDRLRANHDEMTFSTNAGVLVSIIAWGTGAHDILGEATNRQADWQSTWNKKTWDSDLNDKETQVNFQGLSRPFAD